MRKEWTDEETELLKQEYNRKTNSELREIFGRSDVSISKKARRLGMYKSADLEFKNRSEAKRGSNCNFWNGGVATTSKGYKLLKMPGHHRSDTKGYVLEHVYVFEKETGIKIPEGCDVHHINGIKTDNRIENLCMMSHREHTIFHNRQGGRVI